MPTAEGHALGARAVAYLARPHYVEKPWGGRRLATELARTDLPAGPVGESWELCDTDEVRTRVESGPAQGAALHEVLGARFPLLVKVLDAREDLSVQVHPDGVAGPPAKEEAWVALGDGGSVAVGLRAGASFAAPWLERLERVALARGRSVPSSAPTLVHVPAGTVHAVLAGSLVWEVQTPVDVTWRLDDYGRLGLDGRPRALHLEEARDVLARGPESAPAVARDGARLEGRRFWIQLHPPGVAPTHGALAAFLCDGGRVLGARDPGRDARSHATDALDVPRGRSVALSARARQVESPGWMCLAGVR